MFRNDGHQTNLLLTDFNIGDRVRSHPATDVWMIGDRYGTVEKVGHRYVHIKFDASGKIRRMVPENILYHWKEGKDEKE